MTSHEDHSKGGFKLKSRPKKLHNQAILNFGTKEFTLGYGSKVCKKGVAMVPTQENNIPSLRNQCSSLGCTNQDQGCFGPGP